MTGIPSERVISMLLESIERDCEKELQSLKGKGHSVSILEIIEMVTKKLEELSDTHLLKGLMNEDQVRKYIKEQKQAIIAGLGNYAIVPKADVIVSKRSNNWLNQQRISERYYWPLYRELLQQWSNLSVVEKLDEESEKILEVLHDPKDEEDWDIRGLVLGSIQSGKTANYCALTCKAADAGYKIIVVLSGIHNDLRQQTQIRLDQAFTGFHNRTLESGKFDSDPVGVGTLPDYSDERKPKSATTLDDDFKGTPITAEELPWLFVVKKNTTVLGKLEKWLADHSDRPILVIDDEADLASVNTSAVDEATATNRFIRKILKLFRRSAFIGYTATPFANVFIDSKADNEEYSKDLYPKDFIIRLASPANYVGPKELFGTENEEGLGLYEIFEPSEAKQFTKDKKFISKTLKKAILQFILSTAIKWRRFKTRCDYLSGSQKERFESSMLFHVSHLIADHKDQRKKVSAVLEEISADLNGSIFDNDSLDTLAQLFDFQKNEITPRVKEKRHDVDTVGDWSLPDSLDELIEDIRKVGANIEIRVVNGESRKGKEENLDPEETFSEVPKAVLFIGGNKLSRGLTLPGLCVSIFLRGSIMYDTLMQMGRWFGYRDGYLDLCRLYAPLEVIDRYISITDAILDFTAQIDEMNSHDLTPETFGLKVLAHHGLRITSRNKMPTAKVVTKGPIRPVSYKSSFDLNYDVFQNNWIAAKTFLSHIEEFGEKVYSSADEANILPSPVPYDDNKKPEGRLWRNVPTSIIIEFLEHFHAKKVSEGEDTDQDQKMLIEYLKQKDEKEKINYWTVWVPGDPKSLVTKTEKEAGSKFVDRSKSAKYSSDDIEAKQLRFSILKTGLSEYVGVSPALYQAAAASSQRENLVFRRMRKLASDPKYGVNQEGFFQLYLITTKNIRERKDLQTSDGHIPLVSYFMWMPEDDEASNIIAFGNSTISESES